MSLVGNLEDLGLGEILQIVSLSRKSGILALRGHGHEGKIVFRMGQVIQATSSVVQDNLGDLLLRKGLVEIETLNKALHIQRQMPRPDRLGTILSERFGVSRAVIESILRKHVEKIVYSFFGWTGGTFSFELGEPEELAATQFNPLQFMLDQGLNPQWLAMEGGRLLTERQAAESITPPPENSPFSARHCRARKESKLFNLGAELFQELGEDPMSAAASGRSASPGLHLLKAMLQELNHPSLGGGIILLVLRFASEFMNRAVIFSVKEREIIGIGQFGIELTDGQPDVRVRSMRIPIGEPSLFSTVIDGTVPVKVRPGRGRWDAYLCDNLGGGMADEVFLGPVLSEGKAVAVLYGDNLPGGGMIGDTEPLEIFLSQAGMAIEKAFLEQRLQGKMPFPGGVPDACGKKF